MISEALYDYNCEHAYGHVDKLRVVGGFGDDEYTHDEYTHDGTVDMSALVIGGGSGTAGASTLDDRLIRLFRDYDGGADDFDDDGNAIYVDDFILNIDSDHADVDTGSGVTAAVSDSSDYALDINNIDGNNSAAATSDSGDYALDIDNIDGNNSAAATSDSGDYALDIDNIDGNNRAAATSDSGDYTPDIDNSTDALIDDYTLDISNDTDTLARADISDNADYVLDISNNESVRDISNTYTPPNTTAHRLDDTSNANAATPASYQTTSYYNLQEVLME